MRVPFKISMQLYNPSISLEIENVARHYFCTIPRVYKLREMYLKFVHVMRKPAIFERGRGRLL